MISNIEKESINRLLEDNGILFFPEAPDAPLEMDSLTFISLIVDIENTYDISIPPEEISFPPNTYAGLYQYIIKILDRSSGRG